MLGLVLAGGGSKGAYQVGMLKAFREWGIKFDVMTGTSVGAINSLLLAQDKFDILYDIWWNLDFESVIDHKYKHKNKQLETIFSALPRWGLKTTPLENQVRKHISYGDLMKTGVRFGVVYTTRLRKYNTASIENVHNDIIQDYCLASCSIAPFLHARKVNGLRCKDGWYTDNLPIKLAIELGATKIIAINLMWGFRNKKYKIDKKNVLVLKPPKKSGFILRFENENVRRLIELGYKVANENKEMILNFINS